MARPSKFKVGDKVKSVLNKHEEYEVVEIQRNNLVVKPTTEGFNDLRYSCRKGLFEKEV